MEKYVDHISQKKNLKVIAWVELDVSTENFLDRAKANMNVRKQALRKRLTWLTSDVQILNTKNYNNDIEGMEVSIAKP